MEDGSRKVELPENCWESILNRLALDGDQYLQSPSLVCKQFLSITNRNRRKLLADKLNFYNNRFQPLFRALQRFPNLIEVDLCLGKDTFWDGTDSLFEKLAAAVAASPLKHLQALSIRCFFHSPSSPESFRNLGSTMNSLKVFRCCFTKSLRDYDLVAIADVLPCLQELDIHTTHDNPSVAPLTLRVPYPQLSDRIVTDAGIEAISRKLRGLRKVDISWNHACSDRSLIALSSNCVLLNEVLCSNCSITEHGIFSLLRHSPNLISIKVGHCCESSSFVSTVDDYSTICARGLRILDLCVFENLDRLLCSIAKAGTVPLEKLILRRDGGDGDGLGLSLHGLLTFLRACPSLKHLELEGIHFLDHHSMTDLCPYLPCVESVKLLWCSSNLTTTATFFILAKYCPKLSEIVLIPKYHSQVGDDFVMEVDVERNDQITSLEFISNVQLNDELLKRVGVVCPNLRALDVKGCYHLTKEGIGELLQCCSQIKHLRMDKVTGMEILLEQLKTRDIEIE